MHEGQVPSGGSGRSRRFEPGLTLIELIVVLIIILTLAGLLLPVIWKARMEGLKTACKSNMNQIGKALIMYRDDHMYRGKELNPPWLRTLTAVNSHTGVADYLPERVKNKKEVLLCPLDTSYGAEGGKPGTAESQYPELDEGSSYMYEFNMAAECSWDWVSRLTLPGDPPNPGQFVDLDGNPASTKWGEVKTAQMRYGDVAINLNPGDRNFYAPTRFPILRCFWHVDDPDTNMPRIANLAYQGNFFLSGSMWEESSMP